MSTMSYHLLQQNQQQLGRFNSKPSNIQHSPTGSISKIQAASNLAAHYTAARFQPHMHDQESMRQATAERSSSTQQNGRLQGVARIIKNIRAAFTRLDKNQTPNDAVQMLKDDFVLFSLMKAYVPTTGKTPQKRTTQALKQVKIFLKENGARGNLLRNRLKSIAHDHPELFKKITLHSPFQVVMNLHDSQITHHNLSASHILKDQHRLDKKDTGLAHTLVQSTDQSTWFELFKTYDLNNFHDLQAMKETHRHILAPEGKTQAQPNGKITAILGQGSFGKVVPARNIKTGEICAAKKILNLKEANKEFSIGRNLKRQIHATTKDHFIIAEHFVETSRVTKNNLTNQHTSQIKKAYLFSPLATKSNEYSVLLNNLNLKKDNQINHFQYKNSKQIALMAQLVGQLEANGLVHTDLKPDNVFGERIGDIGDVISEHSKVGIHTPAYTAPRTSIDGTGTLSGVDFATFNRFSLGVMILESITGELPTSKAMPKSLQLQLRKETTKALELINTPYYAKGYPSNTIHEVPTHLNNKALTEYDRTAIYFAKQLMADDRRIAHPDNMNLQQWIKHLNQSKIQ